jgi:hypothetical protein
MSVGDDPQMSRMRASAGGDGTLRLWNLGEDREVIQ